MNKKDSIFSLMQERKELEKNLQRSFPMVAATYCVRKNGSAYLAASIEGKGKIRYVRRADQEGWKKLAKERQLFLETIARWVVVGKKLERHYRDWGKKRCVSFPAAKSRKKDG